MYKSIIVPIDLSQAEKGPELIKTARGLADPGARMTVINVIEDVPSYVAVELPAGLLEKTRAEAEKNLAAMVEAAGLEADVEVRSGRPNHVILEAAEEKQADLIIIASHRPGLEDYLLGSTAARVVRHATCSVLVLR